MTRLSTSDLGVYLLAGLFSALVFAVALAALSVVVPGGLGRIQLAGLVVGFLLFLGAHVAAIWIYREIGAREGAS
ncbi:hypothetical protein [Halopenitus persicus]|uniref:hypothetical protein n=1 Tax=Halopenitus persicus TaxID=1048396 RepID=UPI000BBA9ADE|nr:hypothetical protein [Halopenitus persicus]